MLETLEGTPVDRCSGRSGTVLRRSEVKEALAVLRLELAKAGLDLVDSLVAASRYVTAMHNLHGKIQNTGKELLRNTSERT